MNQSNYLNTPSETLTLKASYICKKNIYGKYDLVIMGCFNCNIHETYISLDPVGEFNGSLAGRRYGIYYNDTELYTSILGTGNIFPVKNIPFHLVTYGNLYVVIYNVQKTLALSDSMINVTIVETNIVDCDRYIETPAKIWPPFNSCDAQNKLLISESVLHQVYPGLHYIDGQYKANNISILYSDKCMYKKISHLNSNFDFVKDYEYYCNEYCNKYICGEMKSSGNVSAFSSPDFILDVLKVPIALCNIDDKTVGKYDVYTGCDALGSMYILSDKNIESINIASDIGFYGNAFSYNVQFEICPHGTRITSFDDINQLGIMHKHNISITVNFGENINTDDIIYMVITKCYISDENKSYIHMMPVTSFQHPYDGSIDTDINKYISSVDIVKKQIEDIYCLAPNTADYSNLCDDSHTGSQESHKCSIDHSEHDLTDHNTDSTDFHTGHNNDPSDFHTGQTSQNIQDSGTDLYMETNQEINFKQTILTM